MKTDAELKAARVALLKAMIAIMELPNESIKVQISTARRDWNS